MDTSSPARTSARPAFARWLGTTNEVTRRFLAAGRVPGLINLAGGLPAPEIYPAAELADIARRVILVVLFDNRTTLGLVKLRMKSAVGELTGLFTAMFARDAGATTRVDAGFVGEAEDELDKLFGA